ncbi:MAG: hypothetical protein PHC61_17410 [Chitinivibrionales bacterium]|nr:hypothetical protein [Chitinivibrionales bacterium]
MKKPYSKPAIISQNINLHPLLDCCTLSHNHSTSSALSSCCCCYQSNSAGTSYSSSGTNCDCYDAHNLNYACTLKNSVFRC